MKSLSNARIGKFVLEKRNRRKDMDDLELDIGDEEFQSKQDYGVSEDEQVAILIEAEIRVGFKKDQALVFEEWMKRARMDAINWILKVGPTNPFSCTFHSAFFSIFLLIILFFIFDDKMSPDKSNIGFSLSNNLFVCHILGSIPFKAVH